MNTTTLTPAQHRYYGTINERLNRLKSEVINVMRKAKANQLTHSSILDWITDRVYNLESINRKKERYNVFNSLPEKYRNEVKGYIYGCLDLHRATHIEWILYYDGQYIGHSKREKEATDAMYKRADFSNDKVKGMHVYIGTENEY